MNNDPIINLLKEWKQRGIIATPEDIAKQIRQQVGRELEHLTLDDGSINEEAWRKVCQMRETKEG